jgi:hypothetical protein
MLMLIDNSHVIDGFDMLSLAQLLNSSDKTFSSWVE